MTPKAEEKRLILRLCETYGYNILEMPAERDRYLCSFEQRGKRMIYSTAVVVRLAAPEKSWLAGWMRDRRAAKDRRAKARKKAGGK